MVDETVSDKLIQILERQPQVVGNLIKKLHSRQVFVLTPWAKRSGVGFVRRFATIPDQISNDPRVAAEVSQDTLFAGVGESWYSDVFKYPDFLDDEWLPDAENGFSKMHDTPAKAMAWADQRMVSLGWVLL